MFSCKLHVLHKHLFSSGPSLQQLKFGARVKKCSQYNIQYTAWANYTVIDVSAYINELLQEAHRQEQMTIECYEKAFLWTRISKNKWDLWLYIRLSLPFCQPRALKSEHQKLLLAHWCTVNDMQATVPLLWTSPSEIPVRVKLYYVHLLR